MAEFREKVFFEDAYGKKKTPKALICEIDGDEYIVPDSQIDDDSEVFDEDHEGTLIVNEWWAKKAGLA